MTLQNICSEGTDLAANQCPYHLSLALLITGAGWDGKDYSAENVLNLCVLKIAIRIKIVGKIHGCCSAPSLEDQGLQLQIAVPCFSQILAFCVRLFFLSFDV